MRIICAWCKELIREEEPLENKLISHGMCEECYRKVKYDMRKCSVAKNGQGSEDTSRPAGLESGLKRGM
jgi:hypothetical protein